LPSARAQREYDAANGTLPEAQGWTYIGSNASPTPSVSGGILFQNSLTNNATQAWRRTDIVNDFNIGSPRFFFETNIKVDQSDYINFLGSSGDAWRTGYMMYVADNDGHSFILGLTNNGLRLSTDQNGVTDALSSPFLNFDTTSGFNTYRLEVSNGIGDLYANGSLLTSLPVGQTYSGVSNRVLIGSFPGGIQPGGSTEMHYLDYGVVTAATPEPSTFALLVGMGVTGIGVTMRRRGQKSRTALPSRE